MTAPTPTPAIPVTDWQFWVVTLIVALIIVAVFRPFIPGLRSKKAKRVTLTIERDEKTR